MKTNYSFKQLLTFGILYSICLVLNVSSLICIAVKCDTTIHSILFNLSYILMLITLITNVMMLSCNFTKYRNQITPTEKEADEENEISIEEIK